jgi:hypothetical protein
MKLDFDSAIKNLKVALLDCVNIKEYYLVHADFVNAAKFRDHADLLKKLLKNYETNKKVEEESSEEPL